MLGIKILKLRHIFGIIIFNMILMSIYGSIGDKRENIDNEAKKPNIIYILADDLGYNDLGYNNPNVFTPTLDKLAKSGRIFTQSYFQSMCSPSRGALLTGIYPFKIGMQGFPFRSPAPECAPTNLKLLPEALRENGYKTHFLGKWHLGFCKLECTPTYRGFDTFYGTYLGVSDHYNHTDLEGYGYYNWYDGVNLDRSALGRYSTHLLTDRALKIINSHNATDGPLFMLLSYIAPHVPNQVPDNYLGFYPEVENEMVKTYYAMITAMDIGISTLYDRLVRLNLIDNTLIVFSSDNGGEGWVATSDNTPFRGAKSSLWEGGTRVVTFVHGAMLSNTPQKHDGLIHAVDWYPTLVNIAGSNTDGIYLDGIDQANMILHGRPSQRSEIIYDIHMEPGAWTGHSAIRVGDYKLIWGYPGNIDGWGRENSYFSFDPNQTCTRRLDDSAIANTQPYLLLFVPDRLHCQMRLSANKTVDLYDLSSGEVHLFNIREDPGERNNLADLGVYQDKILQMKKRISKLARYLQKRRNLPMRLDQAVDAGGNWSPGWCDDVDFTVHISGSSRLVCNRAFLVLFSITVATYLE